MGRNTNAVERVRRSAACVVLALPCLLSGCSDGGAPVQTDKAAREGLAEESAADKAGAPRKAGRRARAGGAAEGKSFKGKALGVE